MSANDVVSVSISATGPGPSLPGFGVGLLAACHTVGGTRRVLGPYTSLTDVENAGFTLSAYPKIHAAAGVYFSQQPNSPTQLYIGRRANFMTQVVTLKPQSAVQGTVYTFVVGAVGAVGGTVITYTVPSSSSISAVCTAIAAAMAGAATTYGGTVAATSTTVTWTQNTPGVLTEFNVQVPATILRVGETTASLAGGLSSDLSAMWSENKAWYGLLLDSNSANEVEEAAAWVQSNGLVIFAYSTSDSDVADNTITNDVMSVCKANSYSRTAGLFNQYSNVSYGAVGWMAGRLTATPGSDTWHLKTIQGVQVDSDLLAPEATLQAVQAKNGTVYLSLFGTAFTLGGTMSDGEWADQIRFVDWFKVNLQARGIFAIAQSPSGKLPYTDTGVLVLDGVLRGMLADGAAAGGLVDLSWTTTPPKVSTIATTSKQARTLPAIPFTAKFAGAIHKATFSGVFSV